MTYIDKDGAKKRPYIIHRTSIGCYERTLAMLIEKYGGAFPTWLAPVQVKIMPIMESHHAYAEEVRSRLMGVGIRSEIDYRNEKIGYKIREAQGEKIPYMFVIGGKELENHTVAVRSRKDGDLGPMPVDAVIERITAEVQERSLTV